jgi:uncharacterized protein YoxC
MHNCWTHSGGRLEIQKAIDNLQTQITAIRVQIKATISNSRADNDNDSTMMQARLGRFEEVERENLRAELDALTEEIRKCKAGVNVTEQRNTAQQTSFTQYGPFVVKWRWKSSEPTLAKPIGQLWQESEETRRTSQEIVQTADRKLAEILQRNAKLEEDVARKRQELERTVAQFYGEENLSKKNRKPERNETEGEQEGKTKSNGRH